MAITKLLARKGRLDVGLRYILNREKKEEQLLTATLNCEPGYAARQMQATKQACEKTGGVQYYHMIQSFAPGEITPELALELARKFAEIHLFEYEVVIATHVDHQHIHSHLIFNSVSCVTGKKYHSNARTYYSQVRAVSDRLCREHGLSVLSDAARAKAVSYAEWLRQTRGQPTYRSMMEADLREAIQDANDLGHFFLLMEHRGYEISYGNRLGFRLRGQTRFQYPSRRNPAFTEQGIEAAIYNNLKEIAAGRQPEVIPRPVLQSFHRHTKYTGFLALYYHYLYLLGGIQKRQNPPRMTPHLRQEAVKFEQYRERFAFLREHGISTPEALRQFEASAEARIAALSRQRTILNAQKKRRQRLYSALADEEALAPLARLWENGLSELEESAMRYRKAAALLTQSGQPREALLQEKAALYQKLAKLNQQLRAERKTLRLCRDIREQIPELERDVREAEGYDSRLRTSKEFRVGR